MRKLSKTQIKLGALGFAMLVILLAVWRFEGAATGAVLSAFALIGTLLCNLAGVCPI